MSDEKIASVLGLKPLSEVLSVDDDINNELVLVNDKFKDIVPIDPSQIEENEIVKDIGLAKKNIENIIKQGDDSLTEIISIAKQSQSPRAFEVVSALMKTLLDANKDFVDMSMKKKYAIDEMNAPKEAAQNNVTNNNLIVSTADLLKMLKGDKQNITNLILL
jgi:hypothetical protein